VSSAATASIDSRLGGSPFASNIHPGAFEGARRRVRREPALEFVTGDITCEASDAIVNPAGAGLVDLAIRRIAGPALVDAFQDRISELPRGRLGPGRVLATPGFGLTAAHVIHCGTPVYADDPARARAELAACHVEALRLARALGLTSISFPAIATGVYRYPAREAAEVAVGAVIAELREHPTPPLVRFVLYTPAMLALYLEAARLRLRDGGRS
jgi:O-acetyl-ADP-ribose deacetylase (regulator of RNase III)